MTTYVARKSFLKLCAVSLGNSAISPLLEHLEADQLAGGGQPDFDSLLPVDDETTGLPLLMLPRGFRYRSFGWAGDTMDDGIETPARHHGMAVVAEQDGVVTLVRNHGLVVVSGNVAFGPVLSAYDRNAAGGCSILQFDTQRGEWLGARASLSGTLKNRAGGATPWQSWLCCEETVVGPECRVDGRPMELHQSHGWVFEVPVSGPAVPEPLVDMGRFVHDAVALDPTTGIVYETENHRTAGFYRFLPQTFGQLAEGGRLQMLKVPDQPDLRHAVEPGEDYACRWVDIDDPTRAHSGGTMDRQGCFAQGMGRGGTAFSRMEGCWWDNGFIFFGAISGGHQRIGQIWRFDPTAQQLCLLFASHLMETFKRTANGVAGPRPGFLLCEDGSGVHQRLHGFRSDGSLCQFAANNVRLRGQRNGIKGDFRDSQWTGAAFSDDGEWLFVNIHKPGITFAITGPWGGD